MPKIPVVAGLVIFVAGLTAFVIMSALRLDTTPLLLFIGAAAGVGGFGAWNNTETIKKQTNGPLTEVMDRVASVEQTVGELQTTIEDISHRLGQTGV